MLGNLSDIDLRMLRIFCTIVEAGGFTAAQARLNTSLPRLSVVVRELEGRLGCTLCRRGSSGFMLTRQGQELYDAAQVLFLDIERFRRHANRLGGLARENLQIGTVDSLISLDCAPLPRTIRLFRRQMPNVRLQLQLLPPDELEHAVLEGRLQVAIGAFHHYLSGLNYQPLFEEEQNLYCSREHPLFARDAAEPSIEDICSAEYVGRGYMAENQRPHGLNFNQTVNAYSMEAIATLIFSGTYVGYLPTHYAAPWVARGRLRALLPQQLAYHAVFHCITRQAAQREAVLQCFLDVLAQVQSGQRAPERQAEARTGLRKNRQSRSAACAK